MQPKESINDFVIKFANVNGTGSASANGMFAKAIFRMGIPVSPRNIFPSNIQGLPTWYEVRVSQDGYLGRRGGIDMMVSVNPQSFAKDVSEVEPARGARSETGTNGIGHRERGLRKDVRSGLGPAR